MEFEVQGAMLELIEQVKSNIKKNNVIGVLGLIVFSLIQFNLAGKKVDNSFVVGEVLMIVILILFNCAMSVPIGRSLSKTVISVSFFDDYFIIKTAPVYMPFWIRKPSIELMVRNNDFRFKKMSYPIKSVYDLDGLVYQITADKQEFYIITDFYPKLFKDKFEDILY